MDEGTVQRDDRYLAALLAGAERCRKAIAEDHLENRTICGPITISMGILALSYYGLDDVGAENRGLIAHMLKLQEEDGGFPPYEGGPSSIQSTRLSSMAMQRVLAESGSEMSVAERGAVVRSIERCAAFVEHGTHDPEADSPYFKLLADLTADILFGDTSDVVPNLPLTGLATELLGDTGLVSAGISRVMGAMLPAFGVLCERQAQNQSALARQLGKLTPHVFDRLEKRILDAQDEAGSWGWWVLVTGINLMALRAAEVPRDHPAVVNGIDFIRRRRVPADDGHIEQIAVDASTWELSMFAIDALYIDPVGCASLAEPVLDELLHHQLDDGRWSFSLSGKFHDNDTSSLALKALSRYHAHLPPARMEESARAIRKCTQAYIGQQHDNGGWGAFQAAAVIEFGDRVPRPLESLIDASTAGLTGRIIDCLLCAHASGVLSDFQAGEVEAAVKRADAFLVDVRSEAVGIWWNRWLNGYLPSFVHVIPPLMKGGRRWDDPLFARGMPLLLLHQNEDGGWGESIRADRDASLAACGDSTPVQTAYALIGLIHLAPEGDAQVAEAIAGAVRFLEANGIEGQPGMWKNGRALYTMQVGTQYYDYDAFTSSIVLNALGLYRDYATMGPRRATARFLS